MPDSKLTGYMSCVSTQSVIAYLVSIESITKLSFCIINYQNTFRAELICRKDFKKKRKPKENLKKLFYMT